MFHRCFKPLFTITITVLLISCFMSVTSGLLVLADDGDGDGDGAEFQVAGGQLADKREGEDGVDLGVAAGDSGGAGALVGEGEIEVSGDGAPAELHAAAAELDPVEISPVIYFSTVQSSRFSIGDAVGSQSGYTRSEMEFKPLIDNDILRAITVFPSAQGDDFSARFTVRGGRSHETGVKLDGMELYEPFHLQDYGGAISVIDLDIVSEADLFAGAFSAIHGDSMSGILDIRSRTGRADRFHGKFSLDLLSASVLLDGPLPAGSFLVSARRGYIDLFLKGWAPDLGYMPQYWDTFARADHHFGAKDKVTAYMIYSGDRNEMFHEGEQSRVNSQYDSFSSWLKYSHRLGSGVSGQGGSLDLYLFGGTMLQDRVASYGLVDDRDLVFGGVKGELELPLASGNHVLQAGFRTRWMGGNYDYNNPRSVDLGRNIVRNVELSVDEQAVEGSLWVQDQWRLSRFLMANGGFRVLGLTGTENLMWEPRLSVAITPGGGFLLRGAAGLHHQPLTPLNLPVEEGGHDLGSEQRAMHYVAGVEYRPAGIPLAMKVEAFRKDYWDLVGFVPNLGREETAYISGDEAVVEGVEFFAQGRLGGAGGRFGWNGGYSLMRAEEKLADGRVVPRDSERRHSVTLGVDARLWKNGQVNLMWRYNTGAPYTEVLAIDADGNRTYGAINGKNLKPYHSLDVRVSHGWKFDSWELSGYLQIMNAYNRDNVEEISYTRADDGTLVAQEGGFLPLIPTFGISGIL